jgi:CRISPR-associated exonuclease Cas4
MGSVSERHVDRIFSDMVQKYIASRGDLRAKCLKEGKIVLFVHELCECSYKRLMRSRFPEIERAEMYNPRFALGELIEEALRYRFKGMEENHAKGLTVDGKSYLISGIVDVVEPETGIPIEVKYQTSLQDKPQEHHILQLRLYLWLMNSERGELLYVSPQGLKSFIVKEPLIDEEVIQLIKDEKAPRWQEWECLYCPYQQFCSKSNCKPRKASR